MLNVTSTSAPHTIDSAGYVVIASATQAIDDFNRYSYSATGTIAVSLAETIAHKAEFLVGATEALKATETHAMRAKSVALEELKIGKLAVKQVSAYKAAAAELSETGVKGVGVRKSEPLEVSEDIGKGMEVFNRAGAKATEIGYRDTVVTKGGDISIVQAQPVWNISTVRGEMTHISESVPKRMGKPLSKVMTLFDTNALSVTANRAEGFSLAESPKRQYYLASDVTVKASENPRKTLKSRHIEIASATEAYKKAVNAVTAYELAIAENLSHIADFKKRVSGRVKTAEAPRNAITSRHSGGAMVSEVKHSEIGKKLAEDIAGAISNRTCWEAKADIAEAVLFMEDCPKALGIIYTGAIAAKDVRVLPNPGGILSDIYVGKSGITLAEFEELAAKPAEYTPFTEFKVGEYEYQDALYRLVIRKDNTAANPLIYGLAYHVDVDDVKDRGTATIPAEETKVYFNRNYYTTPDVVVNVAGGVEGETVVPVITGEGTDDAGRYFTIVLKNSSGTAVAGTITWNSNGY